MRRPHFASHPPSMQAYKQILLHRHVELELCQPRAWFIQSVAKTADQVQRDPSRSLVAQLEGSMQVETHMKRSGGFTLIELMIVVAIIGILASIAIPSFMVFQVKSKTSEAKSNLAAIRTAQHSYMAENGAFVSASMSPAIYGGPAAIPFVDTGPATASFTTLGWQPVGRVYFSYAMTSGGTSFTADAAADLDANGVPQVWGIVHPDSSNATVAGAFGCTGVWDASTLTATALNVVGPCGVRDGRSIF
jgi:type IV pilus assembly protein PilA